MSPLLANVRLVQHLAARHAQMLDQDGFSEIAANANLHGIFFPERSVKPVQRMIATSGLMLGTFSARDGPDMPGMMASMIARSNLPELERRLSSVSGPLVDPTT